MTTIVDIWDEARRRMAHVHGARIGADMGLKAMNSIVLHIVYPSPATLHTLQCHLAVLSAANKLEATLPSDFAEDHHWPLPPMPADAGQPVRAPSPGPVGDNGSIEELRQMIGAISADLGDLRKEFFDHDHTPVLSNGATVSWDDFMLRSELRGQR